MTFCGAGFAGKKGTQGSVFSFCILLYSLYFSKWRRHNFLTMGFLLIEVVGLALVWLVCFQRVFQTSIGWRSRQSQRGNSLRHLIFHPLLSGDFQWCFPHFQLYCDQAFWCFSPPYSYGKITPVVRHYQYHCHCLFLVFYVSHSSSPQGTVCFRRGEIKEDRGEVERGTSKTWIFFFHWQILLNC